ncbi:MAG: hypothetical protein EZS28_038515 [Streblomastix strix]|uniref:HECT domain-containing protein n=1 Tax=Streblomastix strix TaxID=222440 RepID=A0A5J4U5R8_9EUKA|nr:MAG: hypothetical protein EZS28_038515 [Streblomastix strix]
MIRRQIIRFVTGSQAEQVKGFAHHVGTGAGDQGKFVNALMNIYADAETGVNNERGEQITVKNDNVRSSGIARLRVAHLCFNRIKILPYISTRMMEAKLIQAVKLSTFDDARFAMT